MTEKEYIEDVCIKAKEASRVIANLSTSERNGLLHGIAEQIRARAGYICEENAKDLASAKTSGVTGAFYDRLLLDPPRLEKMARSIEEIAELNDPVGRIENMRVMPSGIRVGQMRVPLGVVAVIYESRPNVTTDIAALCIKSGNAAILRGGKESIHSNGALFAVISDVIKNAAYPESIISLIAKTDRTLVSVLLKMNNYIDIVVPRGGEGLIKRVTAESTIPLIKHDKGVCHTYIDALAEPKMAIDISINAKKQRPGVCNAMETLLIHKDYIDTKGLLTALINEGIEVRGCKRTAMIIPGSVIAAVEDDWGAEYLDLIVSVKIVDSLDEAIAHITRYGSEHSEAIVTADYNNAQRFIQEIDSSAVLINASTRFHDGGEFGLGAEVGISTQKLHARGTMGIEGLTCLKYVVYGSGQVRI